MEENKVKREKSLLTVCTPCPCCFGDRPRHWAFAAWVSLSSTHQDLEGDSSTQKPCWHSLFVPGSYVSHFHRGQLKGHVGRTFQSHSCHLLFKQEGCSEWKATLSTYSLVSAGWNHQFPNITLQAAGKRIFPPVLKPEGSIRRLRRPQGRNSITNSNEGSLSQSEPKAWCLPEGEPQMEEGPRKNLSSGCSLAHIPVHSICAFRSQDPSEEKLAVTELLHQGLLDFDNGGWVSDVSLRLQHPTLTLLSVLLCHSCSEKHWW